jgi:hypothetical protein
MLDNHYHSKLPFINWAQTRLQFRASKLFIAMILAIAMALMVGTPFVVSIVIMTRFWRMNHVQMLHSWALNQSLFNGSSIQLLAAQSLTVFNLLALLLDKTNRLP